MESLNELVTAMAKGRQLYHKQSRREDKYVLWLDDMPFYPSKYEKFTRYTTDGYKILLTDMSDATYAYRDYDKNHKYVDPRDLSIGMRYFFAGLADAAAEDGDTNVADMAYKISGFAETSHAKRHLTKARYVISDRSRVYEEKRAREADRKAEIDALNESWKYPRTNDRGETEYHTSYGWFTDEQIENLNKCKYFNE